MSGETLTLLRGRLPLPRVRARGVDRPFIFFQGGMGVYISNYHLVQNVIKYGLIGTLSSAALSSVYYELFGIKTTPRKAARAEVAMAKLGDGFVAMNCMVATDDFMESVLGALDCHIDAIVAGAGLPMALPRIVIDHSSEAIMRTALIPIVSSARAAKAICKRWLSLYEVLPDAIIVEGPLAGGHLGFKFREFGKEENKLENVFLQVKKVAQEYGDIPVIVAGGVYSSEDFKFWIDEMGADGIQMGTRFAATVESGASPEFKQAIVGCKKKDIIVPLEPGSPCLLPFRLIRHSLGFQIACRGERQPKCDRKHLLRNGECLAQQFRARKFCICNVLLAAAGLGGKGEKPIFTVGANAYRIDRILTVKELITELGILGPHVQD